MYRWAILLPLIFLSGLAGSQADKVKPERNQRDDQTKDDKKPKAAPLVDIESFQREYDRNKDGFLSKEEMPKWLHYNFARLDTNKDGKISKEELQKGMAYLQQRRRPSDVVIVLVEMTDCDEGCAEEIQRAYQFLHKLDKNKDGKLDADELKAGRTQVVKERIDDLMERLDANKDGKLAKSEARGLLKEHFDKLDTNKDGVLDRAEITAAASAKPTQDKDSKSDSRREK